MLIPQNYSTVYEMQIALQGTVCIYVVIANDMLFVLQLRVLCVDLWRWTRCWESQQRMRCSMNGKSNYKSNEIISFRTSMVHSFNCCTICVLCQDCREWCIREELEGWCMCPVWEELCKGQMAGMSSLYCSTCSINNVGTTTEWTTE